MKVTDKIKKAERHRNKQELRRLVIVLSDNSKINNKDGSDE